MQITLNIVAILLAISSVACGAIGMSEVMVVAALLCVLMLLCGNADKISRIKASWDGGIEAETRAVIEEARATIHQVRMIAKLAVHANLNLVMRSGRWGKVFTEIEKEETKRESLSALSQLGVPKSEIEVIIADWHTFTLFDYAHLLLNGSTVPNEVLGNSDLHREWTSLRNGGISNTPTSAQLEAFLRRAGLLDVVREDLLLDYKHYEQTHEHRRLDVWKQLRDKNN